MNNIATSSIDEALDFALNLIAGAISSTGAECPSTAPDLLSHLTQYLTLRYAGELQLAFEYLEDVDDLIPDKIDYRREQYARQIEWIRNAFQEPEQTTQP